MIDVLQKVEERLAAGKTVKVEARGQDFFEICAEEKAGRIRIHNLTCAGQSGYVFQISKPPPKQFHLFDL